MQDFSIRAFLAGLALFVYGMNVLEDTIKELGYAQLKKYLSTMINTKLKAMRAGTVLAGILQSGTIVSTMVIAFAGAGLLSLAVGISVIIGANVGGTFLSVIIAKVGFDFSISAWALPLISVGGLMQFFKKARIQLVGQLILSFGLLLFGISYLKDSVSALANSFDLGAYASLPGVVFFGGGIAAAALLHSSGTATIIAMTAMDAGVISFEQALWVMLGASIGSSLISLYVSVGGSPIKRQIAYSHVGFNLLGALLFVPLVPWVKHLMGLVMADPTGPDAVAWFQVFYNVVAAIVVYPFVGMIARVMTKMVSDKKTTYHMEIIDHTDDTDMPDSDENVTAYLAKLDNDIAMLVDRIFLFNVHHLQIDHDILCDPSYTTSEKYYAVYKVSDTKLTEEYDVIKTIEEGLVGSLLKRLHTGDAAADDRYLPYYDAIEHLVYSAKALEDTRADMRMLLASSSLIIKERLQTLKKHMVDIYMIIAAVIQHKQTKGHKKELVAAIEANEAVISEMIDLLGHHLHRQRMSKGELSGLLHFSAALERSQKSLMRGLKAIW